MRKYIGFVRMKIERRARWDRLWLPLDILLRHIEDVYWHMKGFTVIECFGDSHVKVMRRLNWMYPELSVRFRTISVMGATAYGLANYGSKSSAREIYEKRLDSLPKNHKVLVMLGEIDAGFLIWTLAEKKKVSVEEMLNETLKRYTNFLSSVKEKHENMYVCSAPLPTVDDEAEKPDYLAARETIAVSQIKRTQMTLTFNALVAKHCDAIGGIFLDFDAVSIDETTGLVKNELINPLGLDHHYEENNYAKIIRDKLGELKLAEVVC